MLTGGRDPGSGSIVTPFGGVEHDWSAIEIAAWLAGSFETTLRLVGTEADAPRGRRDASRLLARASLLVQQVIGIVAEPILVPAGEEGVLAAAREARMLVVGLSERWTSEGIGPARLAVAARRRRTDPLRATRPAPQRRGASCDAYAVHVDARRRAARRLAELLEPA